LPTYASAGAAGASSAAACCEEGSVDARGGRGAGSDEETPRGRPPGPPLPLRGASSGAYNGGVRE